MTTTATDLDTLAVNTIRGLCMDALQEANYAGHGGAVIGMNTFGASAPLKQLLTKFGFTPEQVAQVARERVAAARDGRA